MHTSVDQISLEGLHRAQQGSQEMRSLVAEQAKARICTFIYRMCLDHDLSEDLTQETLLELIRALSRLQLTSEGAFWSWLYRTAMGKVQHHFRNQGVRRMEQRTVVNSEILEAMSAKTQIGPAATLWRKEMVGLILDAMGALTLEYRTVLTLRCLEDQSYAEIAVVLGGSQMRAKMLFYRAKAALVRQLSRKGLRRSNFLGALTVFAAMTSASVRSASAVTSLTAASAKTTVSGAVLGTMLTKTGVITTGIVLAVISTTLFLTAGNQPVRTDPTAPTVPAWSGPGQPQFDSNLQFMRARPVYQFLIDIAASHNPDQDDWQHFVVWPREQNFQSIASLKDKPPNAALVLEQDHWIEYDFLRARLVDRPGPEVGLFLYNEGTLPTVYLTDGDQQVQEISVTHYRQGHAPGFLVLGFDISDTTIGFEVSRVRIAGHDREGRFGGCAITNLAVSLTTQPRGGETPTDLAERFFPPDKRPQ